MALNKHDTMEVKALLGLTNEFLRKDVTLARGYTQQVIRTSSQLQYIYGLCSGYVYMISFSQSGLKMDSALYYLGLTEQLAKAHPEDTRIIKNYNQSAGLFYKAQGEYKRALPYFLENVKLATKDDENKAGTLLNLGNTYSQMADYGNAMKYHLQSLAIFEKIGNKRGQSFCLHSLATDYYFLKQLDKAEEYLQRSLAMKTELGDKRGLVTTWQGLGNVAKDRNQYKLADQYYNKSLSLAREMKLAGD
ncbi:MAG TPA: tetratricopeptide repeat protein, partial [Cyclobacteriaceae bacterium]|nr:tetratricopeptide repeat protein [Cyclobacteriaceae bacterium]